MEQTKTKEEKRQELENELKKGIESFLYSEENIEVSLWEKYGKSRFYINHPSSRKSLGWVSTDGKESSWNISGVTVEKIKENLDWIQK